VELCHGEAVTLQADIPNVASGWFSEITAAGLTTLD
jgi:hypothetical protein